MKRIQYLFYTFLLAIFGCGENFLEQVVEVDLPEHIPALAVTANFSDIDTTLVVYVSNSVGVLEPDQPVIVENATVELYKNEQLLYNLDYKAEGLYGITGIEPLGNSANDYTLIVSAPDFNQISSTQSMPFPVPIENAVFEKEGSVTPDGERVSSVEVTFLDPGDVSNYYSVNAVVRLVSGGVEYFQSIYLESFNPIIEEGEEILIFSDATFNGREVTLDFYTYEYFADNYESLELDVFLVSISEDRYFFEKSLRIFNNSNGNPFVEPIVVHNNIENGHGIFTTESRSVFTIKII